jgi:hypothetical protein
MANAVTSLVKKGRAVRWAALYEMAKLVYDRGRTMYGNLSPSERDRLGQLVRKSKGRRGNLSDREQHRIFELVKKALTGS